MIQTGQVAEKVLDYKDPQTGQLGKMADHLVGPAARTIAGSIAIGFLSPHLHFDN